MINGCIACIDGWMDGYIDRVCMYGKVINYKWMYRQERWMDKQNMHGWIDGR